MNPGTPVGAAVGDAAQRTSSLLGAAVRVAKSDLKSLPKGIGADTAAAFVRAYYSETVPEDLVSRTAEDLAAAALGHLAIGVVRKPGEDIVQVRGTSAARAVVDIVTDDMPFLVDSVTGEVLRRDHTVRFIVHPVMDVVRDRSGRMHALATSEALNARAEAWIHVEVIGPQSTQDLRDLERALRAVLRNVAAAVEDWEAMRDRALAIAAELREKPPAGVPDDEVTQTVELLEWLAANHFTFLGYREYKLKRVRGADHLQPLAESGLGLLRAEGSLPSRPLPGPSAAKAREKRLMIMTKASSRSPVHRTAYMDYVGIKVFNKAGDVTGERRFVGLLTSSAYRQRVEAIPVIGHKMRAVIDAAGYQRGSHTAKDLRDVIESFPRDELFQSRIEQILPVAQAVIRLPERRQTRLFLRRDDYGRFYSALVFLPRDRYSTPVRLKMIDILMRELGGTSYEYSTQSSDSPLARLEFVIRVPLGSATEDLSPERFAELQAKIIEASRSWDDDLADALRDYDPVEQAEIERFADAMPPSYRASYGAAAALEDIEVLRRLERTDPGTISAVADPAGAAGLALRLVLPGEESGHIDESGADELQRDMFRLKVHSMDRPILLSSLLPVLQDLGMEVSDENTFDFDIQEADGERRQVWIYDFVMSATGDVFVTSDLAAKFTDAVAAAWSGVAESDSLGALVVGAGMSWREIALLRAYVHYQRMGGMSYSKHYVEQALVGNAAIAQLIVDLFSVLFDPARRGGRDDDAAAIREQIKQALADVASLEEDRTLSAIAGTVDATLRTNFYQTDDAGHRHEIITLKLDPHRVPDLPSPRPYREIWVYSPRFEGVHLRFGAVARGGLRWSDRREDMRTEILGLVKAQMVKNTVIVPTGAKGGFVPKRLPDPGTDREAWLAEGIACYRAFIRSLLQITDNRVGAKVVPPKGVVRRDDDDPYLVVAADKGTATFSDYANEEAIAAGFWLGDAFASGGSVGYDHKAMGITARGAWESVKRHFRELGIDTQTEDFTAIGIGDMSGDVFGNGMLLSEHIRLVAAFDHRHVFIDPTPDAESSYAERHRLFELPRSSWDDYDRSLISKGGGVWPRTAKSIPLSAPLRTALGIEGAATSIAPLELIGAILKAPVDLFWNGGIGTYVKSSTETNADVGDRANDAIRVNGAQLRCRVVGEGGNLGFTQRGRVEYALRGNGDGGGKINTDAIDNSAGVDTSDHEVNIKILMRRAIDDGVLKESARARLLASMTDEVGEQVLEDNYDQNVTLQMEEANNLTLNDAHRRLMHLLEEAGLLDRDIEFLPSDAQLRERYKEGRGLTSPELAVLLAYSKILTDRWVLDSDLPDDPAYTHLLTGYFPARLRKKYANVMQEHPLHREIVATQVANRIINNAGATGPMRMMEETGASAVAVFRAQTAANRIFDLPGMFERIGVLDNVVPSAIQTSMRVEVQRLVERATRWMLRNAPTPLPIVQVVDRYQDGAAAVIAVLPDAFTGLDRDRFRGRVRELEHSGVPTELATQIASLPKAIAALDLIDLARETGKPIKDVTAAYFALSERLQLSSLLELIIAMPRDGRWRSMARGTLRDDLNGAHAALTAQVVGTRGADIGERLDRWQDDLPAPSAQALEMLREILDGDNPDLASIVVAVQLVRDLVTGSTTTH
ncbi:NAD-glutamate dehydrogenase [Cumulibacter manganitolerans]|uniref:NAD-glutamate dehydrogenase n=1 Tax=Cumulibacter manganitolerans TaxID=1884992 RepID=UPI001E4F81E9|nr:NAD-glutamate dehydrogenase [Cumulibacter manganitolerans]